MLRVLIALLLALSVGLVAVACKSTSGGGSSPGDVLSSALLERTAEMEHRPGLLDTWLDREAGKLWLALPAPVGPRDVCTSVIYIEGLRTGLGSNPVGLDRGQLGEAIVLDWRRVGPRILVEQPNLRFRAETRAGAERRATAESFAPSILWGTEAELIDEDGRALVDVTPFLVRDAHGVVATLQQTGQGSYQLDASRSTLEPDACHAFPDNLEFEATLTFTGGDVGPLVAGTAADGRAVTLAQHHSLVRLPDDGYEPRVFDPRGGAFGLSYLDYAAPLGAPMEQGLALRHRLQLRDPTATRGPVIEPIVYHLDPGVPEPVRSALLDGARWWADAFEAAGFEDAFGVEMLPEGADPLDVRYNVIQWVHRSTRGWSYGNAITDPRTGEILKGHVSLGSLRVRQDQLLFEGLLGVADTGTGTATDPIQLALARLRQLSAHEVGHTLGLAHNFAASASDRASVMDYPAPRITLSERPGEVFDVSDAYAVGVGAWDEVAIEHLYRPFAPDTSGAARRATLDGILAGAQDRGLRYLSDSDARARGSAHPTAHLWDNGADPVAALAETLEIRARALEAFGSDRLAAGRSRALLQEVLAPVYFHHRYQLEAAVKLIGGLDYDHAVIGDGRAPARVVDAERQTAALEAVLRILDPASLDLPDRVVSQLLPRPPGTGSNRELFGSATAPAFDVTGAATTAAREVVALLLEPTRLNRVADQARRQASWPSVEAVLAATTDRAFGALGDDVPPEERHAGLRDAIQHVVVEEIIRVATDRQAQPAVRAAADGQLRRIVQQLGPVPENDHQAAAIRRRIGAHLERGPADETTPFDPAAPPPGSPIGLDSPIREPASWGCSLEWVGS